jgi:pimeloyl-ACP methyl ester carboxylesterase
VTLFQRIHYIWVRTGAALLILTPLIMYLAFRPWGVDARLMATSGDVTVIADDTAIAFEPVRPRLRGLLLLPGCPVDPVAYVPLARRVADRGHRTAIVRIPFRCAPSRDLERMLDGRIASFVARWPETNWVLAGHSRGAAHTVRIAAARPAAFAAYVLMGTSHPRDDDLSALPIEVTKIAATEDGVAGAAQFDTRRLPASTRWVRIAGGNHSQFGYYGFQLFDHRATISHEVQQEQILRALMAVLAEP